MVRRFLVPMRCAIETRAHAIRTSLMHAVLRARLVAGGGSLARETGQTTAEYALVILAAAAVALVLLAWAKSSGKLPAFFDKIIDDLSGSVQ
jgi:Flp pilus assembly pilin Flp